MTDLKHVFGLHPFKFRKSPIHLEAHPKSLEIKQSPLQTKPEQVSLQVESIQPKTTLKKYSGLPLPEYKPATGIPGMDYEEIQPNLEQPDYVMEKWVVPHHYQEMEVNITKLLQFIDTTNASLAQRSESDKITLADFIIMAASNACLDVPATNSQFLGDSIRTFHNTNIAYMGYKENTSKGLVLKDVQKMNISKIAKTRQT